MRWIVRICTALVACVVVAVGLLFMLPTDKIGALVSDRLERQSGRKLTLAGEFKPTFFPVLGVKTGRITISNADWATEPEMVVAQGAALGVNLSALIGGDLEFETLALLDPVIHLERAKDGRVNWDFQKGRAPSGGGTANGNSSTPTLELGRISNGRVVFADRQSGSLRDVSAINGTVSVPRDVAGASADISATIDGQNGSVKLTVADWKAVLAKAATPFEGALFFADANVALKGTAAFSGVLPAVAADFDIVVPDPSKSAAMAGVKLSAGAAQLSKLILNGKVQVSDAGIFAETKFVSNFGDDGLSGTLMVSGDESWMSDPVFATALKAKFGQSGEVRFDGLVGGKALAKGKVVADLPDFRGVLKLAKVDLKTPKRTLISAALLGDIQISKAGVLRLNGARITVDQNTVTGNITVTQGRVPYVEANLSAKTLDVSPYTADGQKSSGGSAGATQTGWSKEPISLQGLDAVNADISLNAKAVNLGVTQLGKTKIALKLRDGQMTLRMIDVRAYRGALSGTIGLSGGETVAFRSDIKARDVQLEPMLGELLDIDRLRGSGTTNLKLTGKGGSLHQIMKSLSGSGDVTFGDGSIRGIDLAAMMRNLKSAFGGFDGATEFSSLTGTFSMAKGILQNVDLSLISPLFKAAGQGSVDVGGQAMNYVVTPTRLSGEAEVSVPVIITGPWNNLKFRPDLEKLIDLLLDGKLKDSEAVKKAEEKLKEAKKKLKNPEVMLQKEIEKKLNQDGGTPGKSLEETAKDKLEDELGGVLKRLFD